MSSEGQMMGCYPSVKRDTSAYSEDSYNSGLSSFLEDISQDGRNTRERNFTFNCGAAFDIRALIRRHRKTHIFDSSGTSSSRRISDSTGKSTTGTSKSKGTSSSTKSMGRSSNKNETSPRHSGQSSKKVQESPGNAKKETLQDITSTSHNSSSPTDAIRCPQQKIYKKNTMVYQYFDDGRSDTPTPDSATVGTGSSSAVISFGVRGQSELRKIYGGSRMLELDSTTQLSDTSNQICILDSEIDLRPPGKVLFPVRGPVQCNIQQPYLIENSETFSPARIMRFLEHNQDGKVIITDKTGTPYLLKSIDKHGALVDADTEKAQSALQLVSESAVHVGTSGLVLDDLFRKPQTGSLFKRPTKTFLDTCEAIPDVEEDSQRWTPRQKGLEAYDTDYIEDPALAQSESLLAFTTAEGNPIKTGEEPERERVKRKKKNRELESLRNSPSLVFESYASVKYDESTKQIIPADIIPLGEERPSQDSFLNDLRKLIIDHNL